jgi:hypothetical protein
MLTIWMLEASLLILSSLFHNPPFNGDQWGRALLADLQLSCTVLYNLGCYGTERLLSTLAEAGRLNLRPTPLMCDKYRAYSIPGKAAAVVNEVSRSGAASANYVRERVCI